MSESIWEEQWQRAAAKEETLWSLDVFGEKALACFGKWIDGDDGLILEAGSGTGRFCLALAKRYPRSKIIGLDASSAAVKLGQRLGRRQGTKNVSFQAGDVFDLPFADNTFDVTFNEGVVEHFHNYQDAVREMVRVTKPGGKIIVSVPNWYCWPHTIYKRLKSGSYQYGYEKSFRHHELLAVFKDFGLADLKISGFNPAYGITRLRGFSKLENLLDRLFVKPFDTLSRGAFSAQFGFEICAKGVKPLSAGES